MCGLAVRANKLRIFSRSSECRTIAQKWLNWRLATATENHVMYCQYGSEGTVPKQTKVWTHSAPNHIHTRQQFQAPLSARRTAAGGQCSIGVCRSHLGIVCLKLDKHDCCWNTTLVTARQFTLLRGRGLQVPTTIQRFSKSLTASSTLSVKPPSPADFCFTSFRQ